MADDLKVTLNGPLSESDITVYVRTVAETALAGQDYAEITYVPGAANNTSVTILAGQTESFESISATTIVDTDTNKDETFKVEADSVAATMGDGQVTIKEVKWKIVAYGLGPSAEILDWSWHKFDAHDTYDFTYSSTLYSDAGTIHAEGSGEFDIDHQTPWPSEHFEGEDSGQATWECSEWGEIQKKSGSTFAALPSGSTITAHATLGAVTKSHTAQPSAYGAENAVEGTVKVVVKEFHPDIGNWLIYDWDFGGNDGSGAGVVMQSGSITREEPFGFECVVDDSGP